VNSEDEIRSSFQPYYEATTVAEVADPQHLYVLQHQLEAAKVYTSSEVEAFCKVFYAPRKSQSTADHAELYRHLAPAVDRFKALDSEVQDEFRVALKAFVAQYSFLAQILPFTDPDLEQLYTFGRFLEMKLPLDPRKNPLKLDADTALAFYRLDRIHDGSIPLVAGEPGEVYGPTVAGSKWAKPEEVRLSEVITILNERFGTDFTEADQLFFEQLMEHAKSDEQVRKWAGANPLAGFSLPMKAKLRDAIVDRMALNEAIATKYLNEADFENVVFGELVRRIHKDLKDTETAKTA